MQTKMQSKMRTRSKLILQVSALCLGAAFSAFPLISASSQARTGPAPTEQQFIVPFSFQGPSGFQPFAGVIQDAFGNLYGTTTYGGDPICNCGTVYKLRPSGKLTVLYAFTGNPDGATPYGGLIRGSSGILFGTTTYGGAYGHGTVFSVSATGVETVLHSFAGGADGADPSAGVILDRAGNLFGATASGGDTSCLESSTGCGTIYEIDRFGVETVLHSFTGLDGAFPSVSLVRDGAGNLYGTAPYGADLSCSPTSGNGCGTVFKLSPSGQLAILHTFTGAADGAEPGNLILDPSGNLDGVAALGGQVSCNSGIGCGVIFTITPAEDFTVLYAFTGGSTDGSEPFGAVILDAAGNLFGTTEFGGDLSCGVGESLGCGVVFVLQANGREGILHSFTCGADGALSYAGLTPGDLAGSFFGTASYGGANGGGVIFRIQLP
jgi:uncharacterized repeat protein (TIGR03803 family)